MNPLKKIYYRLTAHIPRLLPRNESEYQRMKEVMKDAYAVRDEDDSWMVIAGQITGTPAVIVRRPWCEIANAAKRLHINKLAHDHKVSHVNALNKKLEAAFKKEQERLDAEQKSQEILEEKNAEPLNIPMEQVEAVAASPIETTH